MSNSIDTLGGDTRHWNDAVYENCLTVSRYFDDKFEKTAFFLETLSTAYVHQNWSGRESNFWALKRQAYIPSAVFKLFCASETKQNF